MNEETAHGFDTGDSSASLIEPRTRVDGGRAASSSREATHEFAIVFRGSGAEYFRVWIINVLLTLVTAGLYYPWAKSRRLRYFYGHTFVDTHALAFHGDPRRMLRGFLIAVAVGITCAAAGRLSAFARVFAIVVIAGLWPFCFWTSQRFRLANTSWRGLRFRFGGDLKHAYLSMLPILASGALFLAGSIMVGRHGSAQLEPDIVHELLVPVRLYPVPVSLLPLPWGLWLMKRYQHGNFNMGHIRTELRTGAGSFYALALKAGTLLALPHLFLGLSLIVLVNYGLSYLLETRAAEDALMTYKVILVSIGLGIGVLWLVALSYLKSRSQNLVWGHTSSPELAFTSTLRFLPLLRLGFKNTLLILVTFGLYMPFASIASARLRLQAMTVRSAFDPDALVDSHPDRAQAGATGDAAGDIFELNIGW